MCRNIPCWEYETVRGYNAGKASGSALEMLSLVYKVDTLCVRRPEVHFMSREILTCRK